MGNCTIVELTNTYLAYGAADCNERGAMRLYNECDPHVIFAYLYQSLRENGFFTRSIAIRRALD